MKGKKIIRLTTPTLLASSTSSTSSTSTSPTSTSPTSSISTSSTSPTFSAPRYWRCPLVSYPYRTIVTTGPTMPEFTEVKREIKSIPSLETKEIKVAPLETKEIKSRSPLETKMLTRCIPAHEVTHYLSEENCNKECNLLSQLPSALLHKIGVMEPISVISLLPRLSQTMRSKPETGA